jgi:sugar-specific transcriptional regulator TrmB
LSEREIEIYFFLNSNNPTRIITIAKKFNIYKMQAYRILEKMERNGFVFRKIESPRTYCPVPIEKIIRTRMHDLKIEYERIESDRERIIENLKKKISREKVTADKIEVLQGADRTRLAIFEMIKRTKTSYCAINTLDYYLKLLRRTANWSPKDDEDIKRVQSRTIVHLSRENIMNPSSLTKFFEAYPKTFNNEIRFLKLYISPTPVFAIRDDEELVLITNEGEEDKDFRNETRTAIWTTNRRLVVLTKSHFDHLWENSIESKEFLK